MEILFYILISTFLVSLIAFFGLFFLFLKQSVLDKVLLILVALSAGALVGGAFFHLLVETIEKKGFDEDSLLKVFLYFILGFCVFFILEQFIAWQHQHNSYHRKNIKPFSYLILVSDAIHNFVDGLIIASSFIVNISLGFITVLIVALHEIPQEIGDFGVLVYGGMKKTKALFLNFLSAITAIIGGLVGFFIYERIGESIIFLLPFAAGGFIYIAVSDLIPEIKHKENFKKSIIHFLVFLFGLSLMLGFKLI